MRGRARALTDGKAVRSSPDLSPRPIVPPAGSREYRYRFFRKRAVSLSAPLCTSYRRARHNGGRLRRYSRCNERFPWRFNISTSLNSPNARRNVRFVVVYEMYRARYIPDRIIRDGREAAAFDINAISHNAMHKSCGVLAPQKKKSLATRTRINFIYKLQHGEFFDSRVQTPYRIESEMICTHDCAFARYNFALNYIN